MQRLIPVILIIAGLTHLIPLTGVLGATSLAHLYGVNIQDPNLLVLMQHRAVMFGLIGLLLLAGAAVPAYRLIALIGGLISVASFVALAWSSGRYNSALARVVNVDLCLTGCLMAALAACWWQLRSHQASAATASKARQGESCAPGD